jgi:hypothetical protein
MAKKYVKSPTSDQKGANPVSFSSCRGRIDLQTQRAL